MTLSQQVTDGKLIYRQPTPTNQASMCDGPCSRGDDVLWGDATRRDDGKAIGRKSQSSVIGSMFDIIQFYAGGLQEKFRASSEWGWL